MCGELREVFELWLGSRGEKCSQILWLIVSGAVEGSANLIGCS
jgi:hypothetical protein